MTSMDLGSLLSDLVAAKKRMREKCNYTITINKSLYPLIVNLLKIIIEWGSIQGSLVPRLFPPPERACMGKRLHPGLITKEIYTIYHA